MLRGTTEGKITFSSLASNLSRQVIGSESLPFWIKPFEIFSLILRAA